MNPEDPMPQTRRQFLTATAGLALLPALPRMGFAAPAAQLTVASRQLEVLGKAATVYGITGPDGKPGLIAREGDRFRGLVDNQSGEDLILHWHGQALARNSDDRTRPKGGVQPNASQEAYDFPLTAGTHWMHSHTLSEQQLLAAPMVTVEADAGDVPQAVIMLHDFSFRPPGEIAAGLMTAQGHHMGGMKMGGMDMSGMDMSGMDMSGMKMSGMAMTMLLRRMDVPVTVHGFRSGFRDWAAECTGYAHEVAEMALAHTIESAVERAYRRGDLFDKRRRLMDDWATYCATIPAAGANVTPIRKTEAG